MLPQPECCRSRTVELCARPVRVTRVAGLYSVPAGIRPAVRRFGPSLLRLAAGVTVLWFLWRQVGAAPFKDGLRAVTWPAVVAAVTLTALTTVCSAWRWRVVARVLGVDISLPGAGLLLGDAVRRRRSRGDSGESREPDPAPLTREAIRG